MAKQKPSLLYLSGGMTFNSRQDYLQYLKNLEISLESSKKWNGEYLEEKLDSEFNLIRLRLPLKEYARYQDWKIVFEKYLTLVTTELVLVGFSLGAIFLAKYLAENSLKQKIRGVFLVAPPFDDRLKGESLAGGFKLPKSLKRLDESAAVVRLYFSDDDPIIPLAQAREYQKRLTKAQVKISSRGQGHFQMPSFPELIREIKKLA